jgi:uncharacterized protein YndB with AHSA1/START domain
MSLEPIVRQIEVGRPPAEAFRIFTEGMGAWWPADSHSMAADDEGNAPHRVVFEAALGGRIYEVWSDGTEHDWGRVTSWAPPARVVFDWKPDDLDQPFTEVEVTFAPNASGGTVVRLEHRKWELLGAALGAEGRASYANGWPYVFDERFGGAAA